MNALITKNVLNDFAVSFAPPMTFARMDSFAMEENVRLAADQMQNVSRLSLVSIENVLMYARVLQLVEQMQSVMESIISLTVRVRQDSLAIRRLDVVEWIVWLMWIVKLERFAKTTNVMSAVDLIMDVLMIKVVLVFNVLIHVCLAVFAVKMPSANPKPINRFVPVRLHSKETQPFVALYPHKKPSHVNQTQIVLLTSSVFIDSVLQDMNAVLTKTVQLDTYALKENVSLDVVVKKIALLI